MKLWIRLNADVARDPRVGKLAAALGIPTRHALGLVIATWAAMAEHAPDGNLTDVPIPTLDEWAGRDGFAQPFLDIFTLRGVSAEYAEEQGALLRRMERDRQRWHRRNSAESPQRNDGDSAETPHPRNGTERNGSLSVALPAASSAASARTREELAPEELPDPDPDVETEIRTGFTAEQLEALGRLVVRIPPSYRAPMRDFFRSLPTPQRRVAWTYQLALILDGERSVKPTPEQLGMALLEMSANGAGDNSRVFSGYLRKAIAGDVAHAAEGNGNGAAPSTEQRAQETRRAPQNFRAARGKALIEAANIVEWVRDRRSAQYPQSLTPEARAELATNARWTAALKAAGGTEGRILGGIELDKLREQLADALQALDDPNSHPPPPPA